MLNQLLPIIDAIHSALETGLCLCIHLRRSKSFNAAAEPNSSLTFFFISTNVQEVYTVIRRRN